MRRPKTPAERERSQPHRNQRPSQKEPSENQEDLNRKIPGRRNPEYVKRHERVVNEDEQLKDVNYKEDNAQSSSEATNYDRNTDAPQENENERMEAGDDYSEVNPRPRKVN